MACGSETSPIGLVRVPQLNCVKLAARVSGIKGQALKSENMLMLSVELSVTPLPIMYPCRTAVILQGHSLPATQQHLAPTQLDNH